MYFEYPLPCCVEEFDSNLSVNVLPSSSLQVSLEYSVIRTLDCGCNSCGRNGCKVVDGIVEDVICCINDM